MASEQRDYSINSGGRVWTCPFCGRLMWSCGAHGCSDGERGVVIYDLHGVVLEEPLPPLDVVLGGELKDHPGFAEKEFLLFQSRGCADVWQGSDAEWARQLREYAERRG